MAYKLVTATERIETIHFCLLWRVTTWSESVRGGNQITLAQLYKASHIDQERFLITECRTSFYCINMLTIADREMVSMFAGCMRVLPHDAILQCDVNQ